ncbi:MAG: hypothetical protein Q8P42_05510 [Gallionella sp.]|nr:hypothetical protein [Gallionella sp.]
MSREKLTMLLPTEADISELIPNLGCVETETYGDVRHAQAIHQFVADIVATPTNHEAWRDLAHAFGLNQLLRWKYLSVANGLQPNDYKILSDLSSSHLLLGDKEGAFRLMEEAIACTSNEKERSEGAEMMVWWRFPILTECNTALRM